MAGYEVITNQFLTHYYGTFDRNRAELANLYKDTSLMTFEGAQMKGKSAIMEKIMGLPFKVVRHISSTQDAQPVFGVDNNEAVFITAMGQLKTDEDPPHSFTQSFLLRKDGDNFFIANEVFRLVIHHG